MFLLLLRFLVYLIRLLLFVMALLVMVRLLLLLLLLRRMYDSISFCESSCCAPMGSKSSPVATYRRHP